MKLYVCYGIWKPAPRPGGHPCGNAYHALKDAGHDPEVIRSYGLGMLPDVFNQTPGRQEVKRLTGNTWVPVLVTEDGAAAHWRSSAARAASPGFSSARRAASRSVTGLSSRQGSLMPTLAQSARAAFSAMSPEWGTATTGHPEASARTSVPWPACVITSL